MKIAVTLALMLVPATAGAQAMSCTAPAQIERPRPDTPDARQPRRVLPIASYTLALSWSPQYCRNGDAASFQCASSGRFGFTLHGLWPDGAGKDWPQYCAPVPLLSDTTLRANLCATPSAQLLQHEWAKHGSCMKGGADDYFARSTGLYRKLRFPDTNALSRRRGLNIGALASALARKNPGLPVSAVRVTTTSGGWLDEVWLCLDLNFRYARCTPAQGGGAAATSRLKIWRDDGRP